MYINMVDEMTYMELVECNYLQRTERFIQLVQLADKYEPMSDFDGSLLFMASTPIRKYQGNRVCASIGPICLGQGIAQSERTCQDRETHRIIITPHSIYDMHPVIKRPGIRTNRVWWIVYMVSLSEFILTIQLPLWRATHLVINCNSWTKQ